MIAEGATLIGPHRIHRSSQIMKGAVIGKPFRRLQTGKYDVTSETAIGRNVNVGYYSIVGAGTTIGANTILDDFSVVECEVKIGERNLLIYRAQVCNAARIGNGCVIGGLVGERTVVGSHCRIFGKIVHSQSNPLSPWDAEASEEEAPKFMDFAFVGFGAIIAGSVTVGFKAYVLAGAVVTKDVPDYHIAYGVNETVHFSKWPGARLRRSKFFSQKK
jgi:acetyltransferase-like isoleucine patch superfamily enzyme